MVNVLCVSPIAGAVAPGALTEFAIFQQGKLKFGLVSPELFDFVCKTFRRRQQFCSVGLPVNNFDKISLVSCNSCRIHTLSLEWDFHGKLSFKNWVLATVVLMTGTREGEETILAHSCEFDITFSTFS